MMGFREVDRFMGLSQDPEVGIDFPDLRQSRPIASGVLTPGAFTFQVAMRMGAWSHGGDSDQHLQGNVAF